MSDAPELLPCPFCGAVMKDWHGQSFTHPLVETREEACILAGLSFSYQHSRWNTEEVLRWNRRAALSDHPAVKALVAEAEARGMERAAEMIMPYVSKMFNVVIYEGTCADGVTKFPVPFADFGVGVEPEDAHALGIQMTHKDNRWSGLSYTRNDEMRDTEEAVLKKALEPLEAAIRAEAATLREGETT